MNNVFILVDGVGDGIVIKGVFTTFIDACSAGRKSCDPYFEVQEWNPESSAMVDCTAFQKIWGKWFREEK